MGDSAKGYLVAEVASSVGQAWDCLYSWPPWTKAMDGAAGELA